MRMPPFGNAGFSHHITRCFDFAYYNHILSRSKRNNRPDGGDI